MTFTAAFVAHAPDADPEKHQCVVETPKYKLYVRVVRGQEQAKETCRKLAAEEGVTSIVLCPGFTHRDVAEIAEVVGPGCGVNVARGDGPSSRIAVETMAREWA